MFTGASTWAETVSGPVKRAFRRLDIPGQRRLDP